MFENLPRRTVKIGNEKPNHHQLCLSLLFRCRRRSWLVLLLGVTSCCCCLPRLWVSSTEQSRRGTERIGHPGGNLLGHGRWQTDVLWSAPEASTEVVGDDNNPDSNAIGDDDVDGAFSSLDGMLQWAIGNSDPIRLKEKANDVQRMSADELEARRLQIKEVMEKLKMPSDADLMRIAINDLNKSTTSLEDRQRALNELLILVEPIDNANDLNKLGGLVAVIRELENSVPEIRTTSAWVIGKASQNNPLVQDQVLSLGALNVLMKMVQSSYVEESLKALYAISALIRNNNNGQALFYAEDGCVTLQDIMRNSMVDIRLQKKAVQMVADLADSQLENAPHFLKSVINLLSSSDSDLQEKALMAVGSLLRLPYTEALVFKDPCWLDEALESMRERLTGLMASDEEREFAVDLEALRREVHAMFREKLEMVSSAPVCRFFGNVVGGGP
ncbi:unnamed protein product [Spirodela intermedia]|uniref:Nucleotide exchange factor Fes1 domain-containing protein n=1 Tax=Spirodela intermedia TaxID=51605 RepID=A0A7I8IRB8_SPIIN|nr:unnamed protein product [Spirodela intermedia]CAA6659713.1 unnamed protein product [Spirodela intermedia]